MFIQTTVCLYQETYLLVAHIGVGFLRCSFSAGGQCEGLEYGTSKGKIPTPLPYKQVSFYLLFIKTA